jgi:hypothetical protein
MGDDKIMLFVLINEKLDNNLNNRCPATIFADNRMANVKGRIIFLVISIRTIKFIKIIGVPFGTEWAIIFFWVINSPK